MPASFPNSPTPGDTYTFGASTWQWNGFYWNFVTVTGTSGTSGQTGSSGSSGFTGTSGTSNATSGTSGTAGSSGTSGQGGGSGTSGESSVSGTSGTAGTSGTSGTLLSIATSGNNRILTSDGTATGAVAEANLTFNGGGLRVTGSTIISGSLTVAQGSFSVNGSGSILNEINTWTSIGSLRGVSVITGIQNAMLAFGGSPNARCTEEYNGFSWSTGGAMILGASGTGAGQQNSGLSFAGPGNLCTEEYNGTSWSTGGAMIIGGRMTGTGDQNAALGFGGQAFPPIAPATTGLSCTEEYDGTSWTVGGALASSRVEMGGAGSQNAGLAFGGNEGKAAYAALSATEEYNGTAWSNGGGLICARSDLGGAGTQNSALAFGGIGDPGPPINQLRCTEEYNGTAWSARSSLLIQGSHIGCGLVAGAIAYGPGACLQQYTNEARCLDIFYACCNQVRSTMDLSFLRAATSLNFANDTAAASGGVPLGGLYRSGSFVLIRLV